MVWESCRGFYMELGNFNSKLFFAFPQQFPLNCCCATPCRSKHGELLRQNVPFFAFRRSCQVPRFRFFAKRGIEIDEFEEIAANFAIFAISLSSFSSLF
jgi:hypothetical protein